MNNFIFPNITLTTSHLQTLDQWMNETISDATEMKTPEIKTK